MQRTYSKMKLLTLTILLMFLNASDKQLLPIIIEMFFGSEKAAQNLPNPLFKEDVVCWYRVPPSQKYPSGQIVELSRDNVKKIEMNQKRLTVFLLHGFADGLPSVYIKNIVTAYLKMCKNCNILVVKWNPGSKSFSDSAKKVPEKGRTLATGLNLIAHFGFIKGLYTFVGIGLGTHVAGIASQNIKAGVSHVIGLNPAGPGFRGVGEKNRISKLSGKVVEIIHTDLIHGLSNETIGHLDFYVNGGFKQPSCKDSKDEFCNHLISAKYFAEAVTKPRSFVGVTCKGWSQFLNNQCPRNLAPMGTINLDEVNLTHGKYYLRTNHKHPYALGVSGSKPYIKPEPENPSVMRTVWEFFKNIFG